MVFNIVVIELLYIDVFIYVWVYLLENYDKLVLNKVVVFNYGVGYL